MFTGVIVETFMDIKNKASIYKLIIKLLYKLGKYNFFTEEQKEWMLIQETIYRLKPKKIV